MRCPRQASSKAKHVSSCRSSIAGRNWLARAYHVDRGEPERWRVISPAQAYHGPTIGTLALTGRPGLKGPLDPYM
ncbi:MAG: hypothetical protein ABI649_06800 [Gaiellaceae bacterium]